MAWYLWVAAGLLYAVTAMAGVSAVRAFRAEEVRLSQREDTHQLLVAGVELAEVFSSLLTQPFGEAALARSLEHKTTPDDATIETARVAFSRYSPEYSSVKLSEGWQIAARSRRGGHLALLGEVYGTAAEARTAARLMESLFTRSDKSIGPSA
ncbi:hypothetical protein [Streptomyces sp. NPDC058157]|uniref:hypothetical protein n=1 Tax=Streptomyces sp. NPDC058157 TaxID=3346360 RepID=UPI0036E5D21A